MLFMENETKKILSNMTLEELEQFVVSIKSSKYRAKQLHNWIYQKSANSFSEMTNLAKTFREELETLAVITNTKIKNKQVSKDGTIKYLIEFEDGNCIEAVLMRFENRSNLTACISSQVGCALGCKFCATGKLGFVRNLSAQEIVEQVLTIQRDTKLKITNIVFMGQGEPLLNLDNVLKAVEVFNKEFVIGQRRITVSTAGIIPSIEKLTKLDFQPTIAISLHAPSHELRKSLMPIEEKYNLKALTKALKDHANSTNRRVTVEYVLIGGVNDSVEHAKQLSDLIKDIKCNVNLIIYNETKGSTFKKPTKQSIMKFKYILEYSNKKVTIRLERGSDIDAACGQLRGNSDLQ